MSAGDSRKLIMQKVVDTANSIDNGDFGWQGASIDENKYTFQLFKQDISTGKKGLKTKAKERLFSIAIEEVKVKEDIVVQGTGKDEDEAEDNFIKEYVTWFKGKTNRYPW